MRAFYALAETGSYSAAGKSLNVTHAAVMQQVRLLEEHLGLTLAVRSGRGVALTEEGQTLVHELETGFRHIRRGVEAVTGAGQFRPVQVTMSPAFAVKWLMPRLADFQAKNPDVTLLLNPSGQFMELRPGGVELALRYCRREDLPDDADVFFSGDLVVVGSPKLIEGRRITKPGDLMHLPWLQELGTNEVADWFRRHDVLLDRPLMVSHMPGNLIMDAVHNGDGVTYTFRQWLSEDIKNGELIEFFPEERQGTFRIVSLPGQRRLPVRKFVTWLKQQSQVHDRGKSS